MHKSLLLMLGLAASSLQLHAQTPSASAKGEAILDRFIEVTGKASGYQKVQSLVSSGTSTYKRPDKPDYVYRFTNFADRSDQRYSMMEGPAGSRTESGVSQGVAWMNSGQTGYRTMDTGEHEFAVRGAVFLGWSRWRELYQSAAFVKTDGELDLVRLTPKKASDPAVLNSYDRATGLHVRSEWTINTAKGPITRRMDIGDYRSAGAVLVPYKFVFDAGPNGVTTQSEVVTVNEKIPASMFARPKPDQAPSNDAIGARIAQYQVEKDPLSRFSRDYSAAFMAMQQERNCCSTGPDPLAQTEASIDRIIAKFKAVDARGLPPDMLQAWEQLRDKHVAEQEAHRDQLRFLASVQAENPKFRADLTRDPRPSLPPSRVREWDALVAQLERAASEAVATVNRMDAHYKKYASR